MSLAKCSFPGLVADFGGAIYQGGGSLAVTNCTFTGDMASGELVGDGGALYVAAGTVTVQNCAFDNNQASSFGWAIYVAASGSVTISSNTDFVGNTAIVAGNNVYFGP